MENTSVALLSSQLSDEKLHEFLEHTTALFAYRQLNIFGRLGVDSRFAPHALLQSTIAEIANSEYIIYRQYLDHLVRLCGDKDTFAFMQQFERTTEAFHAHTAPVDWIESVTKAYVIGSLNEDYRLGFARLLHNNTKRRTFSSEVAARVHGTVTTLSGEKFGVQHNLSHYAPLREIIVNAAMNNNDLNYRLSIWAKHLAKEFLNSLNALSKEALLLRQLFLLGPEAEFALEENLRRFCDELARRHFRRTESLRLEA